MSALRRHASVHRTPPRLAFGEEIQGFRLLRLLGSIHVILLGDCALGARNGRIDLPHGGLLVNLEGPVLPEGYQAHASRKAGPSLSSNALPETGHSVVYCLANNHMMDYGMQGLRSTQSALETAGARAVGCGSDLVSARETLYLHEHGRKIGIIACCERQFGTASATRPGVADLGPWVNLAIRRAREQADVVIVSCHLGAEMAPWPSPAAQDLYRSWIDLGANVIHGHHAHRPQGWEAYGGGLIFYGLGNALVDPDVWQDTPDALWSLGAELSDDGSSLKRLLYLEVREEAHGGLVLKESHPAQLTAHAAYIDGCCRPLSERALLT